MSSFWSVLISKVESGEMDMEEAHRRDNYYSFAKEMPGLQNVKSYVMDTPVEELPPWIIAVGDAQAMRFMFYIESVREGRMCAYDAAQAYFDAVSG